jgi:hypothetical protein
MCRMTAVLPAASGSHALPDAETVYRPAVAIDVPATLGLLGRGPYDPTTQWDLGGVWRTWRTPQGPATVRIHRPARGRAPPGLSTLCRRCSAGTTTGAGST